MYEITFEPQQFTLEFWIVFIIAIGVFGLLWQEAHPVPEPVPLEVNPVAVILPPPPEPEPVPELEIPLKRISAYNPVPRQTTADPSTSSCGVTLERQIAVSRDYFFDDNGRKHLCGRLATVITDRGEVFENYVINDTLAARFTETVDVMFNETDESRAWAFGITTGTLIIY